MRVVSLLPSATEVLFALGAGEDVVGVTFECDHPPEARTRRIVSTSGLPEGLDPAGIDAAVRQQLDQGVDLYHLDRGALADLQADLVITQDLCAVCALGTSDVRSALDFLGSSADVLTTDPRSLEDVLATIADIAAAVDRSPDALLAGLRDRLAAVDSAVAGLPPVPTVVLEWSDPPYAPGHWVPEMVTRAGGSCLLGTAGERSVPTTWEAVIAADPAVVVCAPCGYGLDAASEQASSLPELPGQLWAVDADGFFVRPGPRLVGGVEALAALLHGNAPDPLVARRLR